MKFELSDLPQTPLYPYPPIQIWRDRVGNTEQFEYHVRVPKRTRGCVHSSDYFISESYQDLGWIQTFVGSLLRPGQGYIRVWECTDR